MPNRGVRVDMESYKPQEPPEDVAPPQHDDANPQQEDGEPAPVRRTASGADHYPETSQEEGAPDKRLQWKEWIELLMLVGILGTLVATCQQNEVMRETLRLDQRSWVGAVGVRESEIKEGVPLQLGVIIKGGGKTPATNVKIRTAWSIFLREDKFCPVYKNNPVSILDSRAVVFPDMEMPFDTAADDFPQGIISQLMTGTMVLYHYGAIDYDDVFTPPTAHCTTFCYAYTVDLKTPQICDTYNQVTNAECEEGCSRPPTLWMVE